MEEPTFNELIKTYMNAATAERIKCGKPSERTVTNVVRSIRRLLKDCHLPRTRKIGELTRQKLDAFLVEKIKSGIEPISARAYMEALGAITPRWARRYYLDAGLDVHPFEAPVVHVPPRRYMRPSKNVLKAVRDWYATLPIREDLQVWLCATMMLEFAMRNGDIARLSWRNFIEKEGVRYLYYTPNKTALSSGRFVCWPVHDEIWRMIERLKECGVVGSDKLLPRAAYWLRKINRELRELGFSGGKASYELRKICIDHVYQKFGAEMASSISGDDIRTVTRYYADPSAVNVTGVRIVDLL